MTTLIRTDQVPAADRLDFVRQISATTWVPMEFRSEYRADYQVSVSPHSPLWSRMHGHFLDAQEKAGFEGRMGPALYSAFRAAGLPKPRVLVETFAEGGPEAPPGPGRTWCRRRCR